MTVSVIIPTYNRASLLERALRSVFSQSQPPDEVIVVDDGSTDETPRLVPENFTHACYVRQENRGVSAARNAGIAVAAGEWLAFLDSDDQWLPRKLEKQLRALTGSPQFKICHTDETWIRRGRRVNPMKKHAKQGGLIFARCLPLCVISPSSVLIHKSIFKELGTFDESLPVCEDYDMWLRICAHHPVLYLTEQLIVKYGGHDDQLSRSVWGMDRFRICALEKILRHGRLTPEDREAATQTLVEKIDVYLKGVKKRGRAEEVAEYERKKAEYSR